LVGYVIRILLARKGRLLREALAVVLALHGDLRVVAELSRIDDLLPTARRERPDVAVLDCALPGPATVGKLCASLLGVVPDCGILVILDSRMCAGVGNGLARLAPRVGLIGTEAAVADLVEGVRSLARGEPVLDVEVAVAALTAVENPLTDREREVLRLAVDGAPTKEIARSLYLSPGTVRNYMSRAVGKTGARTRIEAIRVAQEAGWL
jgi:two-component system, NarL family, response regulator DesR